ncbi:hypothetical protein T07_8653 [Trichinella nelsoni]|uniref:Uncharacterized protein n=1 Tax=Trichinella nelsoni TaxID=6336 RepID=A0A0V0S9X4_9BILA|nr:hypothetical protein T07_8653 [Trichinella nelsoni]
MLDLDALRKSVLNYYSFDAVEKQQNPIVDEIDVFSFNRFCVTVQCVQYLNGQRAGEYGGAVMGSRVGIDLFHSVRCSSGYVTTMPGAVAINQFGKKG